MAEMFHDFLDLPDPAPETIAYLAVRAQPGSKGKRAAHRAKPKRMVPGRAG